MPLPPLNRRQFNGLLAAASLAACGTRGGESPLTRLDAHELARRAGRPRDPDRPLERITFGSCSKTHLPQPLWGPIASLRPDLWIWLGDNVYGDTRDMDVLRSKYEAALAVPGYAALRRRTPVVGTWDDHDYGVNDGGAAYPRRVESQRELLDFLGEPAQSARRRRPGVYASYAFGVPPRRVRVILLDTRYHRQRPGRGRALLGEEQWRWFEEELTGSDAQVHLIAGGIQFLPVDHRFEKWAEFPDERERLFELLGRSRAPVILISGDRHLSEMMRRDEARAGRPLWEVTSSGLTHSWSDCPGEENRYRVGKLHTGLGFGCIELDWEARRVALQVRDRTGRAVLVQRLRLDELAPAAPAKQG